MPASPSTHFLPAEPAPTRPSGAMPVRSHSAKIGGGPRSAPSPKIPPRAPALQMVHPERWGIAGGKLRPIPGTMKLIGGVSGAVPRSRREGGGVDIRHTIAHFEGRGWTVIPQEAIPPRLRDTYDSYIVEIDGFPDRYFYYWQQVFSGSAQMQRDDALYFEWLDYVVAEGLVPPCQDYVVDLLIARAESDRTTAVRETSRNPLMAGRVEELDEQLEILRAERDARRAARVEAGEPAEPKPARARSKKIDTGAE